MDRGQDAQSRAYAAFERGKGGLLHVLQAALLTLIYLVHGVLGSGLAGLASSWALYSLYFALRWPLWLRVYRREGHLEERKVLAEARSQVTVILVLYPILTLSTYHLAGVPLATGLICAVGWALLLVLFGRLPADGPMLLFVFWASGVWRRLPPDRWYLAMAILVAVGWWQHALFVRSRAGGGGWAHVGER
ncbi:MAG: hypothetical protein RDU89_05195 [bacterium]|nr:hypothetical protein [bacterium]